MSQDVRPAAGLVVIGASAGGVEALRTVVSGLRADLAACVLVVMHLAPESTSALPAILGRAAQLPVRHARDGDRLRAGTVLVAPPDHHLVVLDGRVTLTHGPRENGHRPAVDVLFRSAARSWGPRVVAVVLSGSRDDGAAGAVAVGATGGRVVVQSDALFDSMPRATMAADDPGASVPARDVADVLHDWVQDLAAADDLAPGPEPSALMELEVGAASLDPRAMHRHDRPGEAAGLGCPDCAGSLFRIEEGGLVRFRCRVGHAWSAEGLLARQGVALESALWTALRSLEEKAALAADLERRAAEDGREHTAERFRTGSAEATRAAEVLRELLEDLGPGRFVGVKESPTTDRPTDQV